MPEADQPNTRVLPPIVWGEGYRQPCLREGCDNVLCIDRLEDGDIWGCVKCRAAHEFYTAYSSVTRAGGVKFGMVRLLLGDHRRDKGEPGIAEFVE